MKKVAVFVLSSSTGIEFSSIACLLSLIFDFLSTTTILPSSSFASPSTEGVTDVTLSVAFQPVPLTKLKVKSEIAVNPSGGVISEILYEPVLRSSNAISLPVKVYLPSTRSASSIR